MWRHDLAVFAADHGDAEGLAMARLGAISAMVLTVLVLAACTLPPPSLQAEVQVFHTLEPGERGTVAVIPKDQRNADSLEFAAYAQLLERQLLARGFAPIPPGQRPDYEAQLEIGVDGGRSVPFSYEEPVRGVVSFYRDKDGRQQPVYGTTGYRTVTRHQMLYTRRLRVDIVALAPQGRAKVYEGQVVSRGQCGRLPLVSDALLRALFADFPGPTKGVRTIDVPYGGC